MTEPITLTPTDQDYHRLWELNPIAQEQLKTIILTRMLQEERAKAEKPDKLEFVPADMKRSLEEEAADAGEELFTSPEEIGANE